MSGDDPNRLASLRDLGERIATTSHDDLSGTTIDRVERFAREVSEHVDRDEVADGAEKLLAFWESYVRAELEEALEDVESLSESTIDRFEQAFDEELIGVDLYEALETLAIVADMPAEATDEDRLSMWTNRVRAITEDFVSHLKSHRD